MERGRASRRWLSYRPPYDWPRMLAYLRGRAIDGVERVVDERYERCVAAGGATISLRHAPARHAIAVEITGGAPRQLVADVLPRVRRLLDLDADVAAIAAHLARDRFLAPLVAARPGLRVPGAWDGFELAVRAVLGQQVTLSAGRRLASQLVALCGGAGWRAFPTPAEVAAADLSRLGMPGARRRTLTAVAEAALADAALFEAQATLEATIARLCAIRGVGPWTAHYIALRAAREPDAFPASDVALLRAATRRGAQRPTPAQLERRAARWRPWRAYAAQHLWSADADRITHDQAREDG